MKSTIGMAFVLLVFIADMSQQHPAKSKEINLDSIMNNNRLLTVYINCLLDKGRCSRDAEELKKILPDAIQTGCKKCSDAHRRNSRKIVNFMRTKRPEDWKALTAKYDPEGLFKKRINTGKF